MDICILKTPTAILCAASLKPYIYTTFHPYEIVAKITKTLKIIFTTKSIHNFTREITSTIGIV